MAQRQMVDYFLGAPAPCGFAGYFDQLLGLGPQWRVILLKAGPGCGKSTMMQRVGQALYLQGERVERIHCSSDPDSLDGIICPGRRLAMVDATAPHTLEPAVPVAGQEVISLYDCLDRQLLRQNAEPITRLLGRCSQLQERAVRYVTAAGSLLGDAWRIGLAAADLPAAAEFAGRLAQRRLPATGHAPQEQFRLLSANTPNGLLQYSQTVYETADTVLVLEDEQGAVSRTILSRLRREALERGHRFYTCYCPLSPHDKIDHLIFPELSLAVVTGSRWHGFQGKNARVIHCGRFSQKELLDGYRRRLRFDRKTAASLLEQASALQREAKSLHDELEAYYIAAADFDRIDKITAQLLDSL